MIRRIRAVWIAKSALRHLGAGRVEEGLSAIRQARDLFAKLQPSPLQRSDLGRTYHLEAQLESLAGRTDRAMAAFGEAERLLSQDAANREDYGRCLHDAATDLLDFAPKVIVADYIQRARTALSGAGDHYQRSLDELEASLSEEGEEGEEGEEYEAKLTEMLSTSTDKDERERLTYQLARRLVTSKDGADRRRAVPMVLELARSYQQRSQLDRLVAVLSVLPILHDAGTQIPSELSEITRALMERIDQLPRLTDQGSAYQARAVVLAAEGNLNEALVHALRAVAIHDFVTWSVESSLIRTMVAGEGDTARHLALTLALEAHQHELAAELIETARLQVLPAPPAARAEDENDATSSIMASVGQRPLTAIRPVTVTGISRLQELYPFSCPLDRPLSLESCIEQVGGPDSWWWGLWAGMEGRLFWALRDPQGRYQAGCIQAHPDSAAGLTIQTALDASPLNEDASPSDLFTGPFTASYKAEEEISAALGAILVPPALANAVLEQATSHLQGKDDPVSVVLAGAVFSFHPIPLLVVGRTSEGRACRLLHGAVLRTCPPAALVDHIAQHPFYAPDSYLVSLACLNPTGDLEYAGSWAPESGTVLTHPKNRQFPFTTRPATIVRLITGLNELGPSAPATFFYSGHAASGFLGSDLESGLSLQDGVLQADKLFTIGEHGPAIPFPARVLLSACSSAGAGGAGRGEWLGLGAGVLYCGARQVVATAWPIWDMPVTATLDQAVLAAMTEAGDVAAGLRRIQLKMLDRWQSDGYDLHGRDVETEGIPLDLAPPLVWAAYQCLGLRL
jgi:tetratricopeptide (TPR) repeat protein